MEIFHDRLQYEKNMLMSKMFDYMSSLIDQFHEKVENQYNELNEEACKDVNYLVEKYNKLYDI